MDWGSLRTTALNRPDSLALTLERLILSGEVGGGSKFPPERELAAELGVSRTSLRDALRALELKNFIVRSPGTGTVVVDPRQSPQANVIASGLDVESASLAQVMDVRACIEPPVAARAAANATRLEVIQLQRLVEEMHLNQTPKQFAELDRVFHRAIALYTHNPLLPRLLDRITEIIEVSRSDGYLTPARQRSSIAEHAAIVDAIAAKDPVRAHEAAERHIESIQKRIGALDD
ncbi:FadR/GntR family transcriptional regulator [Specibacter cremeus]|uniref:FadR/GntR family transcriptional regulator n=1 Tax=Specibacter cremeus TaxID=1629051 RepID=UPI000F778C3F|nr:FadR/GntR family transcriptional regulator [Specibacter cremeus]